MKPNKIQMLCVLAFMTLCSLTTSAQEVVKEKAYQLRVQSGWTRTQNLPQGIDVGFRKKMVDYELTDDGKKVRRRYTYFLSGRTAFVVQCSAPPAQWASVLTDFDTMLVSLQPGGSTVEKETKSDDAAKAELKRNLPTLLGSFPSQWRCSLSDVTIHPQFF